MKKLITIISLFLLSTGFIYSQNINIKGFGELPVIKQGDNYLIKLGNLGEFAFQGNLETPELQTNVTIDQLSNFPGIKVLSQIGLTNILLHISPDGLYMNAEADTKSSLKKVCDLFHITTPYIELSAAIAPKSLALEGSLEFKDGPVEFFHVNETGTLVKFNSASIASTLEPGSAELGFTTNLLIKPTQYDPELDCTYAFSYDLITQTLSGSGSMMSRWENPLGTSTFLDPGTIVFSNAAVELGINMATLLPVNLGFAMEQGKLFTLDFGVVVSIDPVGKEVAFTGKRQKMNANDFTTFLREGFGLSVPNVLPDIYYIEEPLVLFSPNGGSVGEVEIEKGIVLKGLMHIGDAMQGPVDFKFDMENKLELHMDLNYDFRKFVMNEVRKVPVLAPVMNEILKTFQVRKLYVDLYADKDDMNLNGNAKCDFEVFGSSHHIEFKAALNPEAIAQQILEEIKKAAGPELAVIAEVVGQALNQSMDMASKAWGDASKFIGNASRHLTHTQSKCDNECVPYQARQMYAPILGGGNHAMQTFHDDVLPVIVNIIGENNDETKRLRAEYIKNDWNRLIQKIESDWDNIRNDRTYVSYYLSPSSATNGGHIYRRIIDEKRQGYENLKNQLWNHMMNAHMAENFTLIQNRWKATRIHIENGPVEATEIGAGAWSSNWIIEPTGADWVRIKNRWKGTYLVNNNGKLETTPINPGQENAIWQLEPAEENHVRIKNKKTGTYISVERGTLECSEIEPGWHSAMWSLNPSFPERAWNTYSHQAWAPGQTILVSENRLYSLVFQSDGNLVLYKYGVVPIWNSGTANKGISGLRFEKAGFLVLHKGSTSIWSSRSSNKGGEALYLQNDGNLVIHAPGAIVIWETATNRNPYPDKVSSVANWAPGSIVLMSANKNYRLQFQQDGNLMLLKYDEIELWSSGSYGRGADRLSLQADGNLVVYSPAGPQWDAGCYNRGGKHLILQDDGNLVIYTDNAHPVWATNTVDNNPVLSYNPRTVTYDKNKGCGTIYKYGMEQITHCGWSKNWHTVLMIGCIGNSTAENKLFFYDQGAGTGAIYKIDNNGNMSLLRDHTGWGKDWAKITWEAHDGCNGLIKFELANGYWEKYSCDTNGNITLQSKKQ